MQKDPNYRHYYDDIARNCYNRSFSPSDARAIGHAWSFPPNKQQWLGLIAEAGHPAGSGMLIFYRWLALIKMEQLGLLSQYRSIIITRSDYFYVAPHPPLSKLRPGTIYVPNVEWWGGVTDRHTVLHARDAHRLLSLAELLVKMDSDKVIGKLRQMNFGHFDLKSQFRNKPGINLEQALMRWYQHLGVSVKAFPPVAFTVFDYNDTSNPSRWRVPNALHNSRSNVVEYTDAGEALYPKYVGESDASRRQRNKTWDEIGMQWAQ